MNGVKWTGDNIVKVMEFMHPNKPVYVGRQFSNADELVGVETSEGFKVARIGDWIIRGANGLSVKTFPRWEPLLDMQQTGKTFDTIYSAVLWCTNNRDSKASIVCAGGRLEMRFVEKQPANCDSTTPIATENLSQLTEDQSVREIKVSDALGAPYGQISEGPCSKCGKPIEPDGDPYAHVGCMLLDPARGPSWPELDSIQLNAYLGLTRRSDDE